MITLLNFHIKVVKKFTGDILKVFKSLKMVFSLKIYFVILVFLIRNNSTCFFNEFK